MEGFAQFAGGSKPGARYFWKTMAVEAFVV
jgi:hypothetical protein